MPCRFFVGFLALIGSWLVGVRAVNAFEVRPAILDLQVPSGSSTERELRIRNTDAEPVEVFFTIQKFVPAGGGQPQFLDPADSDGLPSWVRLSAREMRLAPGEERAVRVRIDVPAGAEAGGTYAGLFTTEKPALASSVGIGRRIATLLFVSVDGEKRPARFEMKKGVLERGAAGQGYEVTWENTGGSHGSAVVRLEERRMTLFGPKRSADEAVIRLLPGEQREVRLAWDDRAPFAWVQTRAFLDGKLVKGSERSHVWVHPALVAGSVAFIALVVGVLWRKRRVRTGKGFLDA